jgi:phosphatidylglycerol:prolipoprotein diacylglycerol transferase
MVVSSRAMLPSGFIHRIDPIFAEVGGVYLWWYGLSYTLGFLGTHLWLRRVRQRLGLTLREVYDLTLFFSLGVLIGGRAVEVIFYEWPYYGRHPEHIPCVWLGGMSTHGVLLGAVASIWLFCYLRGKSFLAIADELVIPGAFYMGMGRIGNFIDGQIVGRLADVPWAVQFPDAEGFRHPVVLYDGVKNLLLIPLLLYVRKRRLPTGMVAAHFIFWYAFLRIFVDFYREYPTTLLGLATGQSFNLLMSLLGVFLFFWRRRMERAELVPSLPAEASPRKLRLKLAVFVLILLFPTIMPSDWTQDVPARYGKRHPGMQHSRLYPPVRGAGSSSPSTVVVDP